MSLLCCDDAPCRPRPYSTLHATATTDTSFRAFLLKENLIFFSIFFFKFFLLIFIAKKINNKMKNENVTNRDDDNTKLMSSECVSHV